MSNHHVGIAARNKWNGVLVGQVPSMDICLVMMLLEFCVDSKILLVFKRLCAHLGYSSRFILLILPVWNELGLVTEVHTSYLMFFLQTRQPQTRDLF
jgi:hypothetical protein